MKALIFCIFFLPLFLHADDAADPDPARSKQIEQMKRIVNDPKSTDKELANVAIMEMALIDHDTKELALYNEQLGVAIALVHKAPADPAPSTPQTSAPTSDTPSPPSDAGWHQVTTLSGSADKNSAPFTISSNRWRVKWSLTSSQAARDLVQNSPRYKADNFAIMYASAVSEDSPKADDQDIVSKIGKGSDSTELRGAGTWSIKVGSANADWSLVIEEFRVGTTPEAVTPASGIQAPATTTTPPQPKPFSPGSINDAVTP